MDISIAEAHNRLSTLLKQVDAGPIMIQRHGKTVGVLISPQEYESLRQARVTLQMTRLSRDLKDSGLTAEELYTASRQELEDSR